MVATTERASVLEKKALPGQWPNRIIVKVRDGAASIEVLNDDIIDRYRQTLTGVKPS